MTDTTRVELVRVELDEVPDETPYERVPYVGIRARAIIRIDVGSPDAPFKIDQDITTPGVWEVEYDVEDSYKRELYREELAMLYDMLDALGVPHKETP